MTENKDKHGDKDKDKQTPDINVVDKEHEKDKCEHDSIKAFATVLDRTTVVTTITVTDFSSQLQTEQQQEQHEQLEQQQQQQQHEQSYQQQEQLKPPRDKENTADEDDECEGLDREIETATAAIAKTSNAPFTQYTLRVPTPLNGAANFYRSAPNSGEFHKHEILLVDLDTGEVTDFAQRFNHKDKDEFGTQRVYKKTSPNCVLTLYLPTREITLSGNTPSVLRGIVYVDPKAIQGYRIYAQLTLTFRYGREDEEVMGLRFCNEAIMSLHQVWPRNEEPARESLSPLQEALVKRLGEGAHPFTLTLTPQAPPSVQLVPAKRYYGAPIGTSYDVRCFIADKTDEKFHRRASVKMGVRVIYRTDVFHHGNGPENFAALINSQTASPPLTAALTSTPPPLSLPQPTPAALLSQPSSTPTPPSTSTTASTTSSTTTTNTITLTSMGQTAHSITTSAGSNETNTSTHTNTNEPTTTNNNAATTNTINEGRVVNVKPRKSERGESFPKLRLSPKSFRFSGRFGRSKSEIEKCPNDPFYNYSKSFQEYDSIGGGGGPQGAVDKPFLLQDGRVGLRASLDKAWYTHGEDVCVTVNIRNDSRKTVRKVRVCAIQHVDVCMFNNGKFKNVVADSDTSSPVDRTVPPGGTMNSTIILKPQRGQTKNWIALEDTLQRSTEPEEITGAIAASAIRSPNLLLPMSQGNASPAVGIPQPIHYHATGGASITGVVAGSSSSEDRNVFAIYVSYYVKVKLTLSGMGGELSLKLPFVLVHVDESQRAAYLSEAKLEKLALHEVPANRKNGSKVKAMPSRAEKENVAQVLDRIESADDELNLRVPLPPEESAGGTGNNGNGNGNDNENGNGNGNGNGTKRRLIRSETIAKDLEDPDENEDHIQSVPLTETQTHSNANNRGNNKRKDPRVETAMSTSVELEHVHVVQIHTQTQCMDDEPSTSNEAIKTTEQLHQTTTETTTIVERITTSESQIQNKRDSDNANTQQV